MSRRREPPDPAIVAPRRVGQNRKPRATGLPVQRPEPPAIPDGLGRGRPRVELTERDYEQAETLAGYGLTKPQIANVLGIAPRTFSSRCRDDERLAAALARGQPKAEAMVGEALFLLAVGKVGTVKTKDADGRETEKRVYYRVPDIKAIRWWEMTRAGRKMVTRQETVTPDDEERRRSDEEIAAEIEGIISIAEARERKAAGG